MNYNNINLSALHEPIDIAQTLEDIELMNNAIRVRHSTRSYQEIPLSEEHINLIKEYLSTPVLLIGPLGKEFRFEFLQNSPMQKKDKIGTYGYVTNPQAYIVGISTNEKYTLFDAAYVFHGLILLLTSQNVGTCWLGGIFNQDSVRASTYIAENEIVPAISPLGYAGGKKNLIGLLGPTLLRARKRHPVEEIAYYGSFVTPFDQKEHEIYDAMYLATLSPSAQNKQSWRAVVAEDYSKIDLYVKFHLKKQVHDKFRGYACPPEYLDIAIFYRQLEYALRSHGMTGHLVIQDPEFELPEDDMEYIITWMRDQ